MSSTPEPDWLKAIPPWAMPATISILGGTVRVLQRLAGKGYRSRWGIAADVASAMLAGWLVYLGANAIGLSREWTAMWAGVAGHGGAVTLAWFNAALPRLIERLTGAKLSDSAPVPLDEGKP